MATLKQIGIASAVLCCLCAGCRTTDVTTTHDRSPHAEAIALVVKTQGDVIRTVDQQDWWFDTKAREWTATRPFGPGFVDSTHFFDVEYKVDGVVVAKWFVDTSRQSVQRTPEK